MSDVEKTGVILGIALLAMATVVAWASETAGGMVRITGLTGIASLLTYAAARGVRVYRAGISSRLPSTVGRTAVRIRPSRAFAVTAIVVALVLPLAVAVAVLALVEWAWLPVAGMLLLGAAGMIVAVPDTSGARPYVMVSATAERLVERLSIMADIPVPEVVVEHDVVATAWTAGGRIHVTSPLLELLDDRELEAVLAHEVAHLARRDVAVMEICSAPSRLLLSFASYLTPNLGQWSWTFVRHGGQLGAGAAFAMWALAVLCVPPAFVVGWIARLSVLGMSRAREFAADAAAVALTGRPSALASALLKLEHQDEWAPHDDLRDAVLCIVAPRRTRLGPLFASHPSTGRRAARLHAIERRLHERAAPAA